MLTIQSYLEQYRGWQPKGYQGGKIIKGPCPLHHDKHPSFLIDTSDEHCYCYHGKGYLNLAGLINYFEFGDNDLHAAIQRAEELNGGIIIFPDKNTYNYKEDRPAPTQEQRAVMTAAMHWWHECLWNNAPWLESARARRYFEQERGIPINELRERVQIGYAPAWSHQNHNMIFSSFSSAMRAAVGDDWRKPATEVGLLWKKSGTLALQDRVMFSSVNADDECVFFQGRYVEFERDGQEHKSDPYYRKCMSASTIKKEPFTLKIEHPVLPGTTHVESPFGPVILAIHQIRAYAWLGCIPSGTSLLKIPGPHWAAQDNDPPKRDHNGNIYYPGEMQAQKFMKICANEYLDCARIEPLSRWKDVDKWVAHEGIEPFTRMVEQQQQHLAIA